jgi:hypothetical protein
MTCKHCEKRPAAPFYLSRKGAKLGLCVQCAKSKYISRNYHKRRGKPKWWYDNLEGLTARAKNKEPLFEGKERANGEPG